MGNSNQFRRHTSRFHRVGWKLEFFVASLTLTLHTISILVSVGTRGLCLTNIPEVMRGVLLLLMALVYALIYEMVTWILSFTSLGRWWHISSSLSAKAIPPSSFPCYALSEPLPYTVVVFSSVPYFIYECELIFGPAALICPNLIPLLDSLWQYAASFAYFLLGAGILLP